MSEYDAFAADYDAWAEHLMEDVAWYVELAREADEPIVELAVGSGRVAIPIARETGKRLIGIDRSPAMLAIARDRAAGLPIELREGDIRDFSLDEPVSLVICPARSLMHLPTWHDKRVVFERVAAALRPGGCFAWNVFVYDPFYAAAYHGKKAERGEYWEVATHIPAESRIDLLRGRGETTTGVLTLWWSTKSEWEGLVESAGLEIEALYGGFAREPFTEESREFVWVARKPA